MSDRFEAEAVLRAATSGAVPEEGDVLIRRQTGWAFAPIAGGIIEGVAHFDLLDGVINAGQVPESVVTQHQAALVITESQISDLDHYGVADFLADFGSQDTDDLSEGLVNLYYTDARFDTAFAAKTPQGLSGWPADAAGYLENDGAGNLVWSTPAGTGDVTAEDVGPGVFTGEFSFSHSTLVLDNPTADASIIVQGPAGFSRQVVFGTGSLGRWIFRADNTAESGSNAGSNFLFQARTDAGGILGTIFTVNRANQNLTFAQRVLFANGSLSVPSLAFSAEDDAGFYRLSAGHVLYAVGGSNVVGFGGEDVPLTTHGSIDEQLRLRRSSSSGSPFLSFWQTSTRRAYIQFLDSGEVFRIRNEQSGVVEIFSNLSPTNELLRLKADNSASVDEPFLSFFHGSTRTGYIQLRNSGNGHVMRVNAQQGSLQLWANNTLFVTVPTTGGLHLVNAVATTNPPSGSGLVYVGNSGNDLFFKTSGGVVTQIT